MMKPFISIIACENLYDSPKSLFSVYTLLSYKWMLVMIIYIKSKFDKLDIKKWKAKGITVHSIAARKKFVDQNRRKSAMKTNTQGKEAVRKNSTVRQKRLKNKQANQKTNERRHRAKKKKVIHLQIIKNKNIYYWFFPRKRIQRYGIGEKGSDSNFTNGSSYYHDCNQTY